MPSPEGIPVTFNREQFINSHRVYITQPSVKARINPKDTAHHEAIHTVLLLKNSGKISRVSIIPGPGYAGITEPDRLDPVAAIGPDSIGCNGTEHDRVVAASRGANLQAAAAVARGMIETHYDAILEVGKKLREQKTLDNTQAHAAIEGAEKTGKEITVFIKDPEGNTESKVVNAVVDKKAGMAIVPETVIFNI